MNITEISFKDKSDYLLFVAQWKLVYKNLSDHIRNWKRLFKDRSRYCNKQITLEVYQQTETKVRAYRHPTLIGSFTFEEIPAYLATYHQWDFEATTLLELRRDAKVVAGRQRAAALAAKTTA